MEFCSGGLIMGQNGKGSRPRPKTVTNETWSKNWDNIFKPQKESKNNGNGSKGTNKRKK